MEKLYHKIGRSIVLFQKIEHLFKYAVSRGCFSLVISNKSSANNPIDQLKSNADALSYKTMGCVGKMFCDRILSDYIYSPDDNPLSKDEMRINITINYGTNDHQLSLKSKIETIISERNKIVHQLLNTFDFSKNEDIEKANSYLNEIYDNSLAIYNELSQFAKSIPESIKNIFTNFPNLFVLSDLYNSPFEKELIVMVQYYAELRLKFKKTDGWNNLADIGKFLSRQCPLALKECKIKHKTKSIKKIIERFDLFEIKSTGENKEKTLIRMKPDYWIEKDTENQLFLCKKIPDNDGFIKDDLGMSLVNEPVMTPH